MTSGVRSQYMDVVTRDHVGEGVYRVTIAANERVRQPPELDFGGLSTENYTRNPVVMWAHDVSGRSPSGGLPIGRTLRLHKQRGGKLVVDFEFLSDDPFAGRVRNAWDRGFLRAASISWLPLAGGPTREGQWRDERSELLEWSIVPVPADPDALRQAHKRMLDEAIRTAAADPGIGETEPSDRRTSQPQPALIEIGEELRRLSDILLPDSEYGGMTQTADEEESEEELIEIGKAVEQVLEAISGKTSGKEED